MRREEEGGGEGGTCSVEKNKTLPGVASGLCCHGPSVPPNKLERKEKIIKKRKPQSLCLNSPDAKIRELKMKRKILITD